MASNFLKNGFSLRTQVYGLIILISFISFCVRVVTDVKSTRQYLQSQMASHAQDTATSLGLSISPYLDDESLIVAQTMATAIFDSGYYKQIKFTDSKNTVVFELTNPRKVESVPAWFLNAVELSAPTMSTELNNGWIIAGTLEVTSHTGQSYLTLWEHTKHSFYGSLLLLLGSLVLAFILLATVFKPLKEVEKQAKLVTRKRFKLNPKIPISRELRTVTQAMNNMVINLHNTFDSLTNQTQILTEEVYIDKLTGIGNRRAFENHFNSVIGSITEESPFSAMMITLPSLTHINQIVSYLDGDSYIKEVCNSLKSTLEDLTNAKLFKLNGGTFIIIAPYDIHFLNKIRLDIIEAFTQKSNSLHVDGYANIALINIEKNTSITDTLSSLDTGCTIGEISINNKVSKDTSFSVNQWRTFIKSIIESGEVSFSIQPVKKTNSTYNQCYFEVFTNFIYEGEKINNGHLFAMAEKLNLIEELDKKIIRNFVNVKEQFPKERFALNLSKSSLYSADFIKWLTLYSNTKPILKSNLLFELNEISLLYNVRVASMHIDAIKDIGINVCIEHFGTSLTSFRYLQGLDIEYVKIDGSYTQDLTENSQSQFFVQTVNNICHGFGIKVIACLIEKPDTLSILENLGCDGVQGNLIMQPSKVTKTENQLNKEFTFCDEALNFCNNK